MTRELNSIIDLRRTVGDTEPAFGLQLVVDGAPFDCSDYTISYEAIDDSDDSEHVTETSSGASKTDATTGKVSINCTATCLAAGVYWIRVYAVNGALRRSFPPDGRRIRVTVDDGV